MVRKTITGPITMSGKGLHTGKEATLIIEPADSNYGVKFERTDLENHPLIQADVSYVSSTDRSTCLKKGDAEIRCTEHLLSALSGLGITDVNLKLDGPEVPILDGSAGPFVKALKDIGFQELPDPIEPLVIEEPIQFYNEVSDSSYTILPSDKLEITVLIDFGSETLGEQYATYSSLHNYSKEIAPSKTFVFAHEVRDLFNAGLIKGGDLDNAIVIADQRISPPEVDELAKKMGITDQLIYNKGILNPADLSFSNEPARHKLLDLIGDIALVGRPIIGKIIATKPGHAANIALAKELKKVYLEQRKLKGKPKYDPNIEPLMDTEAVKSMLPHRYPFLLVDKIIEKTEELVVGVKNITFNEALFQGHFPGNPVFPGVLQMEALAQTGGILALSNVEEPHLWDTYFLKMDNVKFKAKVVPGDTLIMKMQLLSPIRRGIVHMQGTAYVGNKIVSEGELTAQIVKRPE